MENTEEQIFQDQVNTTLLTTKAKQSRLECATLSTNQMWVPDLALITQLMTLCMNTLLRFQWEVDPKEKTDLIIQDQATTTLT
jgi:hypothetical protein